MYGVNMQEHMILLVFFGIITEHLPIYDSSRLKQGRVVLGFDVIVHGATCMDKQDLPHSDDILCSVNSICAKERNCQSLIHLYNLINLPS